MKKASNCETKHSAGTGGQDIFFNERLKIIRLHDKFAYGHQKVILVHDILSTDNKTLLPKMAYFIE